MHRAYDAALANSTDAKDLVNLSLKGAGNLRAGWRLIPGTDRLAMFSLLQ
jgi:hypothetical protein